MQRNRLIALMVLLVVASGATGFGFGISWNNLKRSRRIARAVTSLQTTRAKQEKAKAAKAKELADDKAKGELSVCNVCGNTGKFKKFASRKRSVCPTCKSKERHRLLMHYLANASPLAHEKLDVLHFSPETAEKDFLRRELPHLHYVTTDYLHTEELRLDLTQLDLPDASWDVLIVYHILEHIEDDQKAMREMFRVLRPGGMAILQVPIDKSRVDIYEDPTITDPKARTKAFGQKDHVRRYSSSGLEKRLAAAGFVVEPVDYLAQLTPAVVEKHRLGGKWKTPQDERIWLAHKPKDGAKVEAKPDAGAETTEAGTAVVGEAKADESEAGAGDAKAGETK